MVKGCHGPLLKSYSMRYPDVELAACCDINKEKALFVQQELEFSRYYTDIDLMLDSEKPHAVCMVVPEKLTSRLSCKILEKGYSLIMEKPPGSNRKETMEMICAAERCSTPNQVAFNRRYMPLVRKLKKLLVK